MHVTSYICLTIGCRVIVVLVLFIFIIPGGCCTYICYRRNIKKCNSSNCLFTRTSNTTPTLKASDEPQNSHAPSAVTQMSRTAAMSSPSNRDVNVVKMGRFSEQPAATISDSNTYTMPAPPPYSSTDAPPPYSSL